MDDRAPHPVEWAGPVEWADRFAQQAAACASLGSPLWGRLLQIIAADVASEGPSWAVVRERADLRFGQAAPLRLVGAAHRLALSGAAAGFAGLLPSCGGVAPADGDTGDAVLRDAWAALVEEHAADLVAGLDREVQTNEVGRAAGLGYAHAVELGSWSTRVGAPVHGVRLVELGCSGGLNLRLDRFRIDLTAAPGGGEVLGDADSPVRLAPEVRTLTEVPGSMPAVVERLGIDPHPIDPIGDDGRLALLSFVWPDQVERFERLGAAIQLAGELPAHLIATGDRSTAEVLDEVLRRPIGEGIATIVQHSIVWQYVPTAQRPDVTAVIEAAGASATPASPIVWVRYEPDEWDRTRAAIWARRWPDGGDRLIAHADYHGRWLAPVPAPVG